MIELTQLSAFGYIGTILTAGIGIGYKLGERKVVTVLDSYCEVWSSDKKRSGDPKVVMMNTKRVNTDCPEFSQRKETCRLNGKKCILID